MYKLYGLAEALIGTSEVRANSLKELFSKYPILKGVHKKLIIIDNKLFGFVACDG